MRVGIVGYGRFGKLLHELLKDSYDVVTFDKGDDLKPLESCQAIFICVPIREFEDTIQQLAKLNLNAVMIDTCSVKLHPVECMIKYLSNDTPIIATHPLFGPDSYFQEHTNRMMMHPVQNADEQYAHWNEFFTSLNIEIIELTPDEHDRYAARSQGITHLLGRTLQKVGIEPTPIDTLGFERLLGIMNQTCNDSWDLFYDLQHYNPYTKPLIGEIEDSLKSLGHIPKL
jgi:prephenate dehydrogenase